MTVVFVVDKDANVLSEDLKQISTREMQDVEFVSLTTIEQLFNNLTGRKPDLILLHHHWPGLTISQILERVARLNDSTRVIVFTGQSVVMSELIECVRTGVADYWTERGRLDPLVAYRQISQYCSGPEWTLKKLRVPSGSQKQLARAAAECEIRLEQLTKKTEALEREASRGSRGFSKVIQWGAKFAFSCIFLSIVFVVLSSRPSLPAWADLVFVGILAVFFLFAEGLLSEVSLKGKGISGRFKR